MSPANIEHSHMVIFLIHSQNFKYYMIPNIVINDTEIGSEK